MGARAAFGVCAILIAACGAPARLPGLPAASPAHPTTVTGEIREAHLFSSTSGWLLTSTGLFTTTDAGRTWADVSPPSGPKAPFETAYFLDRDHAWAVVRSADVDAADDSAPLDVFSSPDGGMTWIVHHIAGLTTRLDTPGPVYLTFVDPMHGWMVVDLGSHAGFMYFMAYTTADGGVSWAKAAFPQSAAVIFLNPVDGYSVYGGPGSRRTGAFVSHDGGESWSRLALQQAGVRGSPYFELPLFSDRSNGVLAGWVADPEGAAVSAVFYKTADGGRSWKFAADIANPDRLTSAGPASSMGPGSWMAAFYTTSSWTRLARTQDGGRTWSWMRSLLPGALSRPITWSGSNGWAVTTQTGCRGFKTDCYDNTNLYVTADGGDDWSRLLTDVAAE